MFRGINNLTLDAKGRMAIPSRYRDKIMESCGGRLIVTVDQDRCLMVYPLHEWEVVEAKLAALSSTNKRTRLMKRLLIGHATEAELDSQGRILLPTLLREYAGLDKKCILIGQGNKFEIWDEQLWTENQQVWLDEAENDEGDLPEALENLSF
ncbi:MAG: cell division/cell wall cluster transcriptional repressor MraZ [endosymbiont of Galathealinum brachiosum]|uniref:Transcriptional regulator MraZ n=1 Tax=endosymbiont of Galathealinum brachiosum TaxID=2200906 RepID=A0A370D9X2_9GAMM|nr:MAG: cell division/cell wall cluster transcriptional repressor MraZ [endosymbiont of Galathealinum brachiosum]